MTYDNNPLSPNHCPDPQVVGQEAMATILQVIKDRICTDVNAVKNYTAEQITEINNQVIAISNIDGLSEKMVQLDNLFQAVDVNGDGALDDLLQIKTVADQALALAQEAKTESLAAKAQCVQVAQDLASAQTSLNETITVLGNKVSIVEGKVSANETAIANLVTQVDSIEGLTLTEVESKICENNQQMWKGLAEFATSMFADSCIQEEVASEESPL